MEKILKNLLYRKLIISFTFLCSITFSGSSSPMHVYSFSINDINSIFESLNALAVDQSSGLVYISDTTGNKVYTLNDTGVNPILLCNALRPLGIHVAKKPNGASNIWIMAFKDAITPYMLGTQNLSGGTISFPYEDEIYDAPQNIVASLDGGNTKKVFITTPAPALNSNGQIKVFDAENGIPDPSIALNANEYATGLSSNGTYLYAALMDEILDQKRIVLINITDLSTYNDFPSDAIGIPSGIATTSNNNYGDVFLLDRQLNQIQYYSFNHVLIPPKYELKAITNSNDLISPKVIALNEKLGKIYVLDEGGQKNLHIYLSPNAWTKNGISNVQQVTIDQPFPLTQGKKLMSSQIPGTLFPHTPSSGLITLAAGSDLQLLGGEFAPYKLIFDNGLISASTNSIVDTNQPVEITGNNGTIDVDQNILLQILTPIVKTGTYLGKLIKQGLGELQLIKLYNGSMDIQSGLVSVSEGNDIGEININVDKITIGTNASSATLKFLPSQGNIGIFHEIVLNAGGGVFDVTQGSGAAPTKISGVGSLTKMGPDTLFASVQMTYTGGTNLIEGKIYTGDDNVLPVGEDVFIDADGTLDLNLYSQTIKNLTGSGLITSDSGDPNSTAILTLMPDANSAFIGNIQDGTGKVALTINSPGIEQTFTGINTFSGGLNLIAGTIAIEPITLNPVLGTGIVTMEDNTTLRWDTNVTLPNQFVLNAGNPNNLGITMDTGAHTGIIEQALEILGKLIKNGAGELKILVGGTNSGTFDVLQGTFTNEDGGLTNEVGATISNDATFNNTGDIYNFGDFINNVGAFLTSTQGSFSNSGTLTNDGTITSGLFGNEAGANLHNNGTITYLANNAINNYGNFNNNSTVNNNGNFSNHAGSNFNNNGTLNNNFFDNDAVFINEQNAILNNNYSFVNTDNFTNRINATVNNIGEFINDTNANFYNNGLFANTGTLSGDGNFIFDRGEFQDLNSQTLGWKISFGGNGNGGTLTSGPDNILTLTQPITGDESLTLKGPGMIHLHGDSLNYSGLSNISMQAKVGIYNEHSLGTEDILIAGDSTLQFKSPNLTLTNAIELGNGQSIFQTDYATTIDGLIDGIGGFVKTGSAPLTLTEANTYLDETSIREGSLIVEGSIGNVVVEAGGCLTGLWDGVRGFVGNVINDGLITPSNPVGEFRIKGDYSSPNSGTIQIDVSPLIANKIHVEGQANLNGSHLAVNVISGEAADYKGKSFEVLSSDNLITTQFSDIQSSQARYRFKADYTTDPYKVFIEVGSRTLKEIVSEATSDPNKTENAGSFDTVYEQLNHSNLKFDHYMDTLLSLSPKEAADAVAMIVPEETKDLAFSVADTTSQIFDVIGLRTQYTRSYEDLAVQRTNFGNSISKTNHFRQIFNKFKQSFTSKTTLEQVFGEQKSSLNSTDCMLQNTLIGNHQGGIWIQGYGDHSKQKEAYQQLSYHARTGGGLIGIDYKFKPNLVIGAMMGHGVSRLYFQDDAMKARIKGYFMGIYSTFYLHNFYIDTSLIIGLNRFRTDRKIKFADINLTAKGRHNGMGLSPHIGFGYTFKFANKVKITPFVKVDYIHVIERGYKEHNADILNLNMKKKETTFFKTKTGINLSKDYVTDFGIWTPKVSVGINNSKVLRKDKVRANLMDVPLTLVADTPTKTQTMLAPGLSLNYSSFSGLFSSVGYSSQLNRRFKSHEVTARLGWKF